jgi:hypothetical protein
MQGAQKTEPRGVYRHPLSGAVCSATPQMSVFQQSQTPDFPVSIYLTYRAVSTTFSLLKKGTPCMTPAAKDNTGPEAGVTSPWRSTLVVMFIAQLLSIVGFAFVLPFNPFYIREIGVTDKKLVPVWAGILMAS